MSTMSTPLYRIDTLALIQRHNGDKNKATEELVDNVLTGTITFPFKRYFTAPVQDLFTNLKSVQLEVNSGTPSKLFSYFPKYQSYLPPQFRGSPTVISSNEVTYRTVDILSDVFVEDIRLQAKRFDQPLSVHDAWRDRTQLSIIMKAALEQPLITPEILRETIYNTIAETKAFNPSWAKALLELVVGGPLAGKKWLDVSAGLGDRLLTAMALDMEYVGYDPNVKLQPGHNEMIKLFGNSTKHRVIYQPFETANVPLGPYDVSLVSPPFFTIEEYVAGQEGQSIVNYPDYEQWMVRFLYASLLKVWDNLKVDGYLILHLGDNKEVVTTEAANIFIENYLPGASWVGVIGMKSDAGRARPVWVWRKLASPAARILWEPSRTNQINGPLSSKERTLFRMYPLLFQELLRFYADKYAPNYKIRRENPQIIREQLPTVQVADDLAITALLAGLGAEATIAQLTITPLVQLASSTAYYTPWLQNAQAIRDHAASRLPNVPGTTINNILEDNVMIISLLETLQTEGTITWAVAMIKLAVR